MSKIVVIPCEEIDPARIVYGEPRTNAYGTSVPFSYNMANPGEPRDLRRLFISFKSARTTPFGVQPITPKEDPKKPLTEEEKIPKKFEVALNLNWDPSQPGESHWDKLTDEYGQALRRIDDYFKNEVLPKKSLEWGQGPFNQQSFLGSDDWGSHGRYKQLISWNGKQDKTKTFTPDFTWPPKISFDISCDRSSQIDEITGESTPLFTFRDLEVFDMQGDSPQLVSDVNSLTVDSIIPKQTEVKVVAQAGSVWLGPTAIKAMRFYASNIIIMGRAMSRPRGMCLLEGVPTKSLTDDSTHPVTGESETRSTGLEAMVGGMSITYQTPPSEPASVGGMPPAPSGWVPPRPGAALGGGAPPRPSAGIPPRPGH